PDGIVLVDGDGTVVEFLSYDGTFTGVGGPADGVQSTDIGITQPSNTPIGQSLQLIGGQWVGPLENTFGERNPDEVPGGPGDPGDPGEPGEPSGSPVVINEVFARG